MSKKIIKEPEMALDLYGYLKYMELRDGHILLNSQIDEHEVERFKRELREIIKLGKDVEIEINSPGGSVFDALNMYDTIKLSRKKGIKINATACGLAASASSMVILQAVDKRRITENTRVMIHQPKELSIGHFEPSDAEDRATELRKISDQLLGLLSKRCGKSVEVLNKMIERKDVWMSAEEALKFGLVDEILYVE